MDPERDQVLAELAAAARSGDKDALESLCKELQSCVRGFFWNKFQDDELVDELTQETYLRMLKSFGNLRDPSRVRAFVTKVAFHVSQDHLRRKYRVREESLDALLESGSKRIQGYAPDADRVLNQVDLEKALSELSYKARQILLLKVDGFKYEEISSQLGLSVSGVKMQVKRSLERIRGTVFV